MKKVLQFAIRDDDFSFFTNPLVYYDFASRILQDYTLVTGVICEQRGTISGAVPLKFWYSEQSYSLQSSDSHINVLRSLSDSPNFFPAIHGFHHTYNISSSRFIPELQQNNAHLAFKLNLPIAEEFFRSIFDSPYRLFIPPSNTMSPRCFSILMEQEYSLFNVPGVFNRSRPFFSTSNSYIFNRIYCKVFLKHDSCRPIKESRNTWSYNSISLLLLSDTTTLRRIADYCSSHDYPFILALHHWELSCLSPTDSSTLMNRLNDILNLLHDEYHLINFTPQALPL